jgi:hypothetical protein
MLLEHLEVILVTLWVICGTQYTPVHFGTLNLKLNFIAKQTPALCHALNVCRVVY